MTLAKTSFIQGSASMPIVLGISVRAIGGATLCVRLLVRNVAMACLHATRHSWTWNTLMMRKCWRHFELSTILLCLRVDHPIPPLSHQPRKILWGPSVEGSM